MTRFRSDTNYWNNKVKYFLHDPPDKALSIPGHQERANLLLDAFAISSTIQHEEYGDPDRTAAGMDRQTLPGYSKDERENGAVNFLAIPAITHPTGDSDPLSFELPDDLDLAAVAGEMRRLVLADLGVEADSGKGISEDRQVRGKEEAFASRRFLYLYFLLRRRLNQENIGGLGALWERLPADTRLPDHSIWRHNGLVSALASCRDLSPKGQASILVFALTPVQDFIGRARKLRDFWTGSLILSWLVFEGIKAVMCYLGPDHMVYPSLHNQPLVDDWLRQNGLGEPLAKLEKAGLAATSYEVASFPNKFVCLVPTGLEKDVAEEIFKAIEAAWNDLGEHTLTLLGDKMGNDERFADIERIFRRQMGMYWEPQWSAAPLVTAADESTLRNLLHSDIFERCLKDFQATRTLLAKRGINAGDGRGQLYAASHALAQAMLAAGKSARRDQRKPEQGIKCDMFGEFEILHYEDLEDRNPKPSEDPFWKDVRAAFPGEFKETERLCALGLVKRLAVRACRKDHPLARFFKNADAFPSTTSVALSGWFASLDEAAMEDRRLAEALVDLGWPDDKYKDKAKKILAQCLHEQDEARIEDTTIPEEKREAARQIFRCHKVDDAWKYYAVLLMDADKMGNLINGVTLGARWETVLHSKLRDRLQRDDFSPDYRAYWSKRLSEKRLVSPAVHAAISEALGDFSLLAVPEIVERHGGRLIYAGGDDVCAVLPVAGVLEAVREIAEMYTAGFLFYDNGKREVLSSSPWRPRTGRLVCHLGRGEKISISASVLIAHHKRPLGQVLALAHELLDIAKEQGGRNALAVELDKRSGGGRTFVCHWNQAPIAALQSDLAGATMLDLFLSAGNSIAGQEEGGMSSSLAYRLDRFRSGIAAILDQSPELLPIFIEKQLIRSAGEDDNGGDERTQMLALQVAGLIAGAGGLDVDDLPVEALIVAKFIGWHRRCWPTFANNGDQP